MGSIPALNHRVLTFIKTNHRIWLMVNVRQCSKGESPNKGPCKPQNKPVSVADRTINLAQPDTKYCVKPIQREQAVRPKPCPPPRRPMRPPVAYPTGKPIKVCTARDMKKVCPPKPCDCPPCMPPETWQQKLRRWALFLLKAAVTGGLVYWTVDMGVWGDGDEAVELYQTIWSNVLMIYYQGAEVEPKQIQIPNRDKLMHQTKEMWNKGVVTVCGFIATAPGRLIGLVITPTECPEEEEENGKATASDRDDDDIDRCAEDD